MFQQLLNSQNPATTLAASSTDTAATISVESIANLSATPIYTIAVQTAGAVEFMLVTAITGSGPYTLTVTRHTEGSTAATHSNGDAVYCPLTAGALSQALFDTSGIGTYANRPTSTTGARAGMRYKCTDSPYEFVFDGVLWQPFMGAGPQLTLPDSSMFSWDNQGSVMSETSSLGYLYLAANCGDGSGSVIRGRITPLSSTTFTYTVLVAPFMVDANYHACGIYLNDGTKKFIYDLRYEGDTGLAGIAYSAYNSYDGTARWDLGLNYSHGNPIWLRIQQDATTRYFQFSADGLNWYTAASHTKTTFLTPTSVGYFARPQNGTYPVAIAVYSLGITYP